MSKKLIYSCDKPGCRADIASDIAAETDRDREGARVAAARAQSEDQGWFHGHLTPEGVTMRWVTLCPEHALQLRGIRENMKVRLIQEQLDWFEAPPEKPAVPPEENPSICCCGNPTHRLNRSGTAHAHNESRWQDVGLCAQPDCWCWGGPHRTATYAPAVEAPRPVIAPW